MIYIASKTKHAAKWRELCVKFEVPIISTWINEAEAGQTADLGELWVRMLREVSLCDFLLLYVEPGEVLGGALIELGAALAANVKIRVCHNGVMPPQLKTAQFHPSISFYNDILDALDNVYPKPCKCCGLIIVSDDDLEWHGLGNCVDVCEACFGAGDVDGVPCVVCAGEGSREMALRKEKV